MHRSSFAGKKGISPLIATVLLLAFAVALGTIAVSYLLDFANPDPCNNIAVSVENACYANEEVTFIAANNGDESIVGMQVRFTNLNKEIKESPVSLSLASGSASTLHIPYQTLNPAGVTLTVIPKMLLDGKEKFCSTKEAQTKLGAC